MLPALQLHQYGTEELTCPEMLWGDHLSLTLTMEACLNAVAQCSRAAPRYCEATCVCRSRTCVEMLLFVLFTSDE